MRPRLPTPRLTPPRLRGFTLVELIVTIVLFGVMAATLTIFFKPALDTWLTVRTRGDLFNGAELAMRRILQDVRAAVPNSIRTPGTDCFELVPTTSGGRYRTDIDLKVPGAAPVDPAGITERFDVLTPMNTVPTSGDWLVVDNQNPGDVYAGTNRTQIKEVGPVDADLGRHRLYIAPMQFPLGYDGARFVVVPAKQEAVFYVCSGASESLNAQGDAPGVLYRLRSYGFNAAAPSRCPATERADVLARGLRSCRFLYTANQGATQQSGFISIELAFTRNNETASLVFGGHVDNTP